MSKRTIVIGDLHGVFDEARDLLDKVAVTSSDHVIFLGDLCDRGPKSWECIQLAKQYDSVLGNHEEKHLKYRDNPQMPMSADHQRTWNELTDEDLDYFDQLPVYIKLPEYNAVVVHAGVLPNIKIEDQSDSTLLHCQNILPPGTRHYWPSKSPPGYKFWTNFWTGPERVIFGHSVLDKPLVSKYAVGIDTGCVFGHRLTAVILPEWEIVSVPARKAYHYSRHRSIATYEVMDGVKCYS